mgnify:CR=1 FL=1
MYKYEKIKATLKLFFNNQFINFTFLKSFLNTEKLYIADVGSTGGIDSRWLSLDKILKIYTFDPDPRAKKKYSQNIQNFNIGLWSSKKKLPLYLTHFPDASSVFKPNKNLLDVFINSADHDVVKKKIINVNQLDVLLDKNKYPDFIKVDAEGADFEILLGAKKILKSSCMGLQVEAQFIERNTGSRIFSDINDLLVNNGFIMYSLEKESWLRKNKFSSIDSKLQVIWADVTYLISIDELVKRLKNSPPDEKRKSLSKLLLICLAYKFYDYGVDLLIDFNERGWITNKERQICIDGIKKNMKSSFTIIFLGFLKLFFTLILLIFSFLTPIKINSSLKRFKRSVKELLITLSNCFN